ncbi:hypothetical protein NDU88_002460 [Pleurodeles waltl]|uniref:Uncharacterized protein n=1 Tax=Pleurodeles waltl TaxID=8319 RepID=A0AAV7WLA9_PLEWA|nr:hypothetical protein NDU88_002460 [Pleurodeles waltl]
MRPSDTLAEEMQRQEGTEYSTGVETQHRLQEVTPCGRRTACLLRAAAADCGEGTGRVDTEDGRQAERAHWRTASAESDPPSGGNPEDNRRSQTGGETRPVKRAAPAVRAEHAREPALEHQRQVEPPEEERLGKSRYPWREEAIQADCPTRTGLLRVRGRCDGRPPHPRVPGHFASPPFPLLFFTFCCCPTAHGAGMGRKRC